MAEETMRVHAGINYTCKNTLCRVVHDGGGVTGPAKWMSARMKHERPEDRSTKETLTGRRLYNSL